ncbi:hypothetical protein KA107_01440 [Candidatus Pacearchaeota archaeon]|nr:hypothetical protein [Candidatus Pacearchaeota archaeon]
MGIKINLLLLLLLFPAIVGAATGGFDNGAQTASLSSYNSQSQFSNPTFQSFYSGSDISTFWPQYSSGVSGEQCEEGTDFLITIPPAGCSPAVVRTDLLGEQNVPVFCQLVGAKVNPLIKVSSIKSISFKGKYPDEIAGVSFHPARAALRSYNTLLGSPVINDLGYVVIVLKKQPNETTSKKFVSGNLTATMAYDAQNAFGTGSAEYYLETANEEDWQAGRGQASFWQGRGLLRVVDVKGNTARVAVYTTEDRKLTEFNLKVGETSSKFYFPGFYCNAGIKVKLNNIVGEEDKALLDVDGDQVWVVKGAKILDGRCSVLDVNLIAGTTGTVKIRCPSSTFELSLLNSLSANILEEGSASDTLNLFNVSNVVYNGPKNAGSTTASPSYQWYLAYTGISQFNIDGASNPEFIVLVGEEPNKKLSSDYYSKLNAAVKKATSERDLEQSLARALNLDVGKIKLVVKDDLVYYSNNDLIAPASYFNGFVSSGKELTNVSTGKLDQEKTQLVKEYFDNADSALQELLETNPSARDAYSTYGEQGIISAMGLIQDLSSKGVHDYDAKRIELMNKFLELYPDSSQASYVRDELSRGTNYDSSKAYASAYVNNVYHTISVKEFYSAPLGNRKASLVINPAGGKEVRVNGYMEGQKINFSTATNPDYAIINDIQPRYVGLDFYTVNSQGNYSRVSSKRFQFDSSGEDIPQKIMIGKTEYTILISDVEVKEVAQVSLISELKTRSEANFTFKIGIEPRLFPINPEKAKEVSDDLNKTIKEWEDRNKALGDLLEKWKGVCLATGFGLQVKNLFGGFTGESLARQEVMKTYKNYCLSNETIGTVEARSLTKSQCYGKLSTQIDADIACYKKSMDAVNTNIGKQTLEQWKNDSANVKQIPVTSGGNISTKDFYTFEDTRSYLLNQQIQTCGSEVLKRDVSGTMNNKLYKIYAEKVSSGANAEANKLPVLIQGSTFNLANQGKDTLVGNYITVPVSDFNSTLDHSNINEGYLKLEALLIGEGANSNIGVATTKLSGSSLWTIVIFNNLDADNSHIKGVYHFPDPVNGKISSITEGNEEELKASRIVIKPRLGLKCEYTYKSPKVKFYDSEPNKGMPAVVPFNKKGWYVLVPQSSGGLLSDNVKGYTAAGVPTFYYLCSVGPNGVMELKGGDDSCFSNNVNTGETSYGGCALSAQDVSRYKSEAESAVRQAAQQYGKNPVQIAGFGALQVDSPMTSDGSVPYECEDFMSIDDCKLLYNVCDPVICPSSRCNFGGQVNVPNVIQSGIVGSMLLCSKNFVGFGGDVFVPFCLTGVHAGIEGYISILKAQRDCMAEAAKTGKHVGICDEVTAVYKCEFFWRQAAPLMQNLIPNLAEFIYTGGSKGFGNRDGGGGEYATFQASWDNMQKSIDYFKNSYASTSFRAVQFGNIEEVGTEFCNAFVGTSIPGSAKAWDQLVKPESPYQFYAQFSEIPFTEATVPATSQYKVFYHIYAGNDQGVRYEIYLKNPPSSSYYYNAQRLSIKTGYIAAGQQVSETKDLTSPAGYKELCVVVNGREECGFKSVTTDFGLDSISSSYAKDQAAQTDIKTEKECIQGSPSVYGLVNANPQAGVETATQPNIALNGIVRVCATDNPGKGTNSARWKQVGTCGADTIKCWLDETSVNDAVKQVYEGTGSVASAQEFIEKKVNTNNGVFTEADTAAKLIEVKNNISGLKISSTDKSDAIETKIKPIAETIDKLVYYAYWDLQKAEALLQKYFLYRRIVVGIAQITDSETPKTSVIPPASASPPATPAEVASTAESAATVSKFSLSGEKLLIDGKDLGYTITMAGAAGALKDSQGNILATINKDNGVLTFKNTTNDFNVVGLQKCTFELESGQLTGC